MGEKNNPSVREIIDKWKVLKKKGEHREALVLLEEALTYYPRNDFLRYSLGETFFHLKRYQEADAIALEILAENPHYSPALTLKGDILYSTGLFEEALSFYYRAYSKKKNPFLAVRLIKALLEGEEYEEAFGICQDYPDHPLIKKQRARIYAKRGEEEKASTLYQDYLEDRPQDLFAYKERIRLKIKDMEPEDAVRELKTLIKVGGRSKNAHLHTLLASSLERLKEYERAVLEYEKALQIDPENMFNRKQLGFCLARIDRGEEAIPLLVEVFRQDPRDFYVRNKLLSLYREYHREEEGKDFFIEIIKEKDIKSLWSVVKRLDKEEG